MLMRRGHTCFVELQYPAGDEQTVKPVRDQIHAHRRDHDPDRTDGLAAFEGDDGEGRSAEKGKQYPAEVC